jgi:hypothetical protein
MRGFGIGYCAALLAVFTLACFVYMCQRIASVQTLHAPSPVRTRACQTATEWFDEDGVSPAVAVSNRDVIISPKLLSGVSPTTELRSPSLVQMRGADDTARVHVRPSADTSGNTSDTVQLREWFAANQAATARRSALSLVSPGPIQQHRSPLNHTQLRWAAHQGVDASYGSAREHTRSVQTMGNSPTLHGEEKAAV